MTPGVEQWMRDAAERIAKEYEPHCGLTLTMPQYVMEMTELIASEYAKAQPDWSKVAGVETTRIMSKEECERIWPTAAKSGSAGTADEDDLRRLSHQIWKKLAILTGWHFGEEKDGRETIYQELQTYLGRRESAHSEECDKQIRTSWAASPEMRELVKEIVAIGKPYLEDCDIIGMKNSGWKATMPKLSQWLSICARAKRLLDKALPPAPEKAR